MCNCILQSSCQSIIQLQFDRYTITWWTETAKVSKEEHHSFLDGDAVDVILKRRRRREGGEEIVAAVAGTKAPFEVSVAVL